jgi:hypothetical protein
MAPATLIRRLRPDRRTAIRDALAALMREVAPTPFVVEGPGRAGVRARLCTAGWRWGQADAEAAAIIESALKKVGAKRPTWQQGQSEYTQEGHAPILRERCKRCAKPLPEGALRYCGPVCAKAAKVDQHSRRDKEAVSLALKAYRAAWIERQPERECPVCRKGFRQKQAAQQYCSRACYHDARRLARRNMPVVCKGL